MTETQSSIAHILRGYDNFEDVYQNVLLLEPLILQDADGPGSGYNAKTGGRSGRDATAGVAYQELVAQWRARGGTAGELANLTANLSGIDPWLAPGTSCVPNSSLTLWLPMFKVTATKSAAPVDIYPQYTIFWRLRSPEVFRNQRKAFSYPQSIDGFPQATGSGGVTFAGAAQRRIVIPTCTETVAYPQIETGITSPGLGATLDMYKANFQQTDFTNPISGGLLPNIDPTGTVRQIFCQGYSNASNGNSNQHVAVTTVCKGDEFVVLMSFDVSKFDFLVDRYNFDTTSRNVSTFFGRDGFSAGLANQFPNPGLGAYAIVGSR